MQLTNRDRALLDVLLRSVRFLSLAQVGRMWWGETKSPERNASRRLRQLEQGGFVHLFSAVAHAEVFLEYPIFSWSPGQDAPDFFSLAAHLHGRWPGEFRPTASVIASEKAARLLGGSGGRFPRATEETHDLHLSSVYLHFREHRPDLASTWQHEDECDHRPGQKVPDAYVGRADNRVAIELAGKYSREKLSEFHLYCESRRLPYELW